MFVGPEHHTSANHVTYVSAKTLLLKAYSLSVLGLIQIDGRVLDFDGKIYKLRFPTRDRS